MSGRDLPQRAPRRVERHVAAADHHDVVAELHVVAEVHVEEEVDRLQHAVELDARDLQLAAPHRPDGDEDRREPVRLAATTARSPHRAEPRYGARRPSSRIARISASSRSRRSR